MTIFDDIKEAIDKLRYEPYRPSTAPILCKYCGKWYGESTCGIIMGDCGKHT